MDYGALCLIPLAVVIIFALITKRTLEALLLGTFIGFIIISPNPKEFIPNFINSFYAVIGDATTIWVILVCGLFGSLIALIEKSGGTEGFARLAAKAAKGRKSALIFTWILGIIIFIDEYLNALAVGFSMRRLTDKYNIPREELAFVANSTGATVTVLIPFTTWSAFMISQIIAVLGIDAAEGTATYMKVIPFVIYGWVAVLVVPLFIARVIPVFGPMKKAIKRAEEGQCLPDTTVEEVAAEQSEIDEAIDEKKARAINFIIPMVVLAVVTVWTADLLYGVLSGIIVAAILFLPQKLLKPTEFFDAGVKGFEEMFFVLAIVVVAFVLAQANDQLGLTPYVINAIAPILSPKLLAFFSFIVVALLALCTGSFWGIAAIAFPIILPLAQTLDVNVFLAAGAVVSGASFGSQACFFSDAATLTCKATQIKNSDYMRNVLPLLIVPFVIACIVFLIVGIAVA